MFFKSTIENGLSFEGVSKNKTLHKHFTDITKNIDIYVYIYIYMCLSVMVCVVCPKSGKKNNKQTEGEIKNLDRTNTLQRLAGGTSAGHHHHQHVANRLQEGPSSLQQKSGSLVASMGGSSGQGWVGGA